ncbi:methyltransferase domain-containing protein [Candidatus Igneacidithiobacillus taiwanensis]|uniref:class I SAM-dependent methyltransferase n=1 Tax=Candidatus Igneacidithiobacillus taiwanensis TaxID=1945924 RepID=UPI002897F8CC|nr:methyltransferase domain-containing protein [Candidatus Igneacidithiobacillus taiwanensis]
MKRVYIEDNWPESWKDSYQYDLQEIYGEIKNRGYAYAYDNRRHFALSMLTEVLEPGARVLDIAAAQGNFSLAMAELGYDVTWNDLREELADYVIKKHENGAISFSPGNAFDLKFSTLFDGVLITEVIEHVAHPDDFLANTAKLVRPGGYIIMTTPNGEYFRNRLPKFSECEDPTIFESIQFRPNADGHIFLLYRDEVESFAADVGLRIDRFALFNNPLTSGHVKLNVLLNALPKSVVAACEGVTQRLPVPLASKISAQMAVRFQKPATN